MLSGVGTFSLALLVSTLQEMDSNCKPRKGIFKLPDDDFYGKYGCYEWHLPV